jgi:hypothetical protein
MTGTGNDYPLIQNMPDGSQARRDGPTEFWRATHQKIGALGPDDWDQAKGFCAIQNGHIKLAVRLARADAARGEARP